MGMIDNYLDEVCSYITSIPCQRAVRRELKNHMEDLIDAALAEGMEHDEAVRRAVSMMGDAREAGIRFRQQFSVRPNHRLILYILGIFLLYAAAGADIHFSLAEIFLAIPVLGGCFLLFFVLNQFDLEGNYRLIKYFLRVKSFQ